MLLEMPMQSGLAICLVATALLGYVNHRSVGLPTTIDLTGSITGALIMIGPHLSLNHGASLGVLAALANAVFSAIAMMFLRLMSGSEQAITFYFSLTVMVCAALTALQG